MSEEIIKSTLTVPEAKEVIASTTKRISKEYYVQGKTPSILSLLLEVQEAKRGFPITYNSRSFLGLLYRVLQREKGLKF